MAGEIYIADKATLDSVNEKVSRISELATSSLDYYDISIADKLVISSNAIRSSQTAFNISGSGLLYLALATTNQSSTSSINITIDGTNVFNRRIYSAANLYSGIAVSSMLKPISNFYTTSTSSTTVYDNYFALPDSTGLLGAPLVPFNKNATETASSPGLVLLDKPLRFNSSFNISSGTDTNPNVVLQVKVYYILD